MFKLSMARNIIKEILLYMREKVRLQYFSILIMVMVSILITMIMVNIKFRMMMFLYRLDLKILL